MLNNHHHPSLSDLLCRIQFILHCIQLCVTNHTIAQISMHCAIVCGCRCAWSISRHFYYFITIPLSFFSLFCFFVFFFQIIYCFMQCGLSIHQRTHLGRATALYGERPVIEAKAILIKFNHYSFVLFIVCLMLLLGVCFFFC